MQAISASMSTYKLGVRLCSCADLVPELLLPDALCLAFHQLLLQDGSPNLLLLATLNITRLQPTHNSTAQALVYCPSQCACQQAWVRGMPLGW
jgi:hypothetical protein